LEIAVPIADSAAFSVTPRFSEVLNRASLIETV
jgi:hypothetical protein